MFQDSFMETQFSIFMVNKPGVLSQVLGELAKAKLNIIAMTMMDSVEHGVMRLIVSNKNKAKEVLDKLNLRYSETSVLCLRMDNKAGSLAQATQILAKEHINISYAYCTAGGKGGKATGVLKVANVKRAIKVIKDALSKTNSEKEKKRTKKASSQRRAK